ncbi:BTB/POZ domain-containing protein At2g24240-like [Curcuma longa]|uniref:BTB/POZ domain-containing protein At2g24240-like n=1 Tax=Curcuma longa TaxID=136217 RepID=UPI003D9F5060
MMLVLCLARAYSEAGLINISSEAASLVKNVHVNFFYESLDCSLGDVNKLQWLDADKCLMVATLFPRRDTNFIGLLDFIAKGVVWSWSDANTSVSVSLDEKCILHATTVEETRPICIVNQYDDLGFINLRSHASGVRWSSRSKLTNRKAPNEERCYPKLATHDGQLFSSMNDGISIFYGPEWVLTSMLRQSFGGSICDFLIDGDRLFVLHSEENVFDVWETPSSPTI